MKNNHGMKRVLFIFLLLFLLLLSGCGKIGQGGKKKQLVFRVFSVNRENGEAASVEEKLVEEFNKQSKEYEIEL